MALKKKCRDCGCFVVSGKNWYITPSRYGKSIEMGFCHCHGYNCLANDEACSDFTEEDI